MSPFLNHSRPNALKMKILLVGWDDSKDYATRQCSFTFPVYFLSPRLDRLDRKWLEAGAQAVNALAFLSPRTVLWPLVVLPTGPAPADAGWGQWIWCCGSAPGTACVFNRFPRSRGGISTDPILIYETAGHDIRRRLCEWHVENGSSCLQ